MTKWHLYGGPTLVYPSENSKYLGEEQVVPLHEFAHHAFLLTNLQSRTSSFENKKPKKPEQNLEQSANAEITV